MALIGVDDGFGPLVISAITPFGVCMDAEGTDLAGLLASRWRRAAAFESGGGQVPAGAEALDDLPLPLARCDRGAVGWHWAASCARPLHPGGVRHALRSRSVDVGALGWRSSRPWPRLAARRGAYKDTLLPYEVVCCAGVSWRAVGDAAMVRDLLAGALSLGKNRAVGEGLVSSWSVRAADVPRRDWEAWCHADERGMLLRPVPVECARRFAAPGSWQEGVFALRPPSWERGRLVEAALPADPDAGGTARDPWEEVQW